MEPLEEFPNTAVGQYAFNGVESVAQFVVAPGFVDEILAGMACGNHLGAPFAPRDDMMSTRGDLTLAENAPLGPRSS